MLSGRCARATVRLGDGNSKDALPDAGPNQNRRAIPLPGHVDAGHEICRHIDRLRAKVRLTSVPNPSTLTRREVIPHRPEIPSGPIDGLWNAELGWKEN